MFQLRTTGKWSLAFSGSAKVLGFTIFDESFSESGTLWDETLSCELRPRIARVEDRMLILHAGPNAGDRFDGEGDVAEPFTVYHGRHEPTSPGRASRRSPSRWTASTRSSLTWARVPTRSRRLTPSSSPSSDVAAQAPTASTAAAVRTTLRVDDADDAITGGPGDDVLRGGDGVDSLNGGGGDDDLDGEADADTVRFADAFGNDTVVDSGDVADRDALDFSAVTQALDGRLLLRRLHGHDR